MAYTSSTRIDGPSLGSADAWYAWAADRGAARLPDVRLYLDTIYEWASRCNLKAHAIVTQSIHETAEGGVPWASYWWKQRCNPAGIGITGDPAQNNASRVFRNGREAALAHLVHASLYVHGTDLPDGLTPDMDPRWSGAATVRGLPGNRKTLASFGSDGSVTTWAVDPAYGDKWAGWLNRTASLFEGVEVPDEGNEGRPDVAGFQKVQFVGAKGPVWLPDDIEVIIDIVPSRIGNVRSNQRSTAQRFTTWHDTGNPSSDARGERNYLHSGAGGRAVGYNFAFDAKRIYQLTPLDEVTWHAGTAEGNRVSWGAEQCLNTDWNGALRVGAALHGGLCQMMGWSVDTALVPHKHWYGKWCPAQILNRGAWSQVVKMTSDAALAAAGAATGGAIPPSAPVYAEPVPIPELAAFAGKPDSEIPYRVDGDGWVALYVGDRVQATTDTPRRRYSSGDELVGGPVKAGEAFDVDWLLISADFPDTYLTPWLTRIRAGDTVRVADVKQDATPAQGG